MLSTFKSHTNSMESDFLVRPNTDTILGTSVKNISIDDFQLMKVIGRGSFGKVYMAKKKDNHQIYAIKTLKKDFIIRSD